MPNGSGRVVLSLSGDRTVATRLIARSPLRLLTPRPPAARAASVIASSFGGGLVAGDDVRLELHAGAGTTTYLGTQASTKVYRAHGGLGCRQGLTATVARDAVLVVLPDPVAPFAGAIFEQRQRIDLDPSASLVWVDGFTSGRVARGERWAFESYSTRNDIYVGDKHVLADALRLDSRGEPVASPHRVGGFDCFATAVLLGPRVSAAAAEVLGWVREQPLGEGPVAFAGSPLGNGAILRVAGPGPQAVGQWLRDRIALIVTELLDADPWRRKF